MSINLYQEERILWIPSTDSISHKGRARTPWETPRVLRNRTEKTRVWRHRPAFSATGEAEAEGLPVTSRQPVNLTTLPQNAIKDWEPSIMVDFFLYMPNSRIDRASNTSTRSHLLPANQEAESVGQAEHSQLIEPNFCLDSEGFTATSSLQNS